LDGEGLRVQHGFRIDRQPASCSGQPARLARTMRDRYDGDGAGLALLRIQPLPLGARGTALGQFLQARPSVGFRQEVGPGFHQQHGRLRSAVQHAGFPPRRAAIGLGAGRHDRCAFVQHPVRRHGGALERIAGSVREAARADLALDGLKGEWPDGQRVRRAGHAMAEHAGQPGYERHVSHHFLHRHVHSFS